MAFHFALKYTFFFTRKWFIRNYSNVPNIRGEEIEVGVHIGQFLIEWGAN